MHPLCKGNNYPSTVLAAAHQPALLGDAAAAHSIIPASYITDDVFVGGGGGGGGGGSWCAHLLCTIKPYAEATHNKVIHHIAVIVSTLPASYPAHMRCIAQGHNYLSRCTTTSCRLQHMMRHWQHKPAASAWQCILQCI